MVEVEIQYENIPYSECFYAGHLTDKCPFSIKPGTLRKPPSAQLLPKEGFSITAIGPEAVEAVSQPSLSTFAKEAVSLHSSSDNHASFATEVTIDAVISISPNSAIQVCPSSSPTLDISHNFLEKIPVPVVDLSNLFSVLEHYSVIAPTSFTSLSNNLIAALRYPPDPLVAKRPKTFPIPMPFPRISLRTSPEQP